MPELHRSRIPKSAGGLLVSYAALFLGLSGGSLAAQMVTGKVVDESDVPIEGALVSLVDASGVARSRTLSSREGRYLLPRRSVEVGRIVVERIGFARHVTDEMRLPATGQTLETIVLSSGAVPIEGIQVEVPTRFCPSNQDDGGRIQQAWSAARTALRTVAVSRDLDPLQFELEYFTRELNSSGKRILGEERQRERISNLTPFRSFPTDSLVETGFIVQDGDSLFYRAPDVEVLLSPAFLSTHCLGPLEERERSTVALAFRPVPTRAVPEIEGELLLDRESWELREVRFRYVNAPDLLPSSSAEGQVEFAALPDGRWVVGGWTIRMPLLERQMRPDLWQGPVKVAGYWEEGAFLRSARTWAGQALFQRSLGSIVGVLVDSAGASPLSRARIELRETGTMTDADSLGRFEFRELTAGTYGLMVRTPESDSLALPHLERVVEVEAGRTHRVRIQDRSIEERVVELCPPPDTEESSGAALHVVLRDSVGRPYPPGTAVRITWDRFAASESGSEIRRTTLEQTVVTDSAGVFTICGMPQYMTYRVSVEPSPGAPAVAGSVFIPVGTKVLASVVRASSSGSGSESPVYALEPLTVQVQGRRSERASREGAKIYRIDLDDVAERRETARDVGDVIAGIPGVRLFRRGGLMCITTRRVTTRHDPRPGERGSGRGALRCRGMIPVYLDGVRLDRPEEFLQSLPAADIRSIEYVPGLLAGVRYGTGAANGVLLIFTRAGGA